jgi:hypothetical protein
MAGPQNSPNSGKAGDEFKNMLERLKRGERVEIYGYAPVEAATQVTDTFNIRVRRDKNVVTVMSGGYKIEIVGDSEVVVYGKDGKVMHKYTNKCLVQNILSLLFKLVKVPEEGKLVSVQLDRSIYGVRRLQSWVLGVITNFGVHMKHNPQLCDPKMLELGDSPA